jgi:hypothetical protein
MTPERKAELRAYAQDLRITRIRWHAVLAEALDAIDATEAWSAGLESEGEALLRKINEARAQRDEAMALADKWRAQAEGLVKLAERLANPSSH